MSLFYSLKLSAMIEFGTFKQVTCDVVQPGTWHTGPLILKMDPDGTWNTDFLHLFSVRTKFQGDMNFQFCLLGQQRKLGGAQQRSGGESSNDIWWI